ncbi:hypothetical protein BGZ72_008411 [Mortierella alpina]|nr:hypothetical protein BGZ72_008411 [Mortierella alpina]
MSSKEILGEYTKVAAKLEHINATLQEMNAVDVAQLIDKIRTVERKMGLVYTLFKSSVYSVSKQNQEQEEDEAEQNQQVSQEQDEQEQEQESRHTNMQYNHGQQSSQGFQAQEHQEYHEQGYQPQQQRSSQPYPDYAQQRSSIYPSYEPNTNQQGSFFSGVNRPPQGQSAAAREEYQASTGAGGGGGDRALLSLSRGYSGTRWTHTGRRDTESHTNRPRFY